MSSNTFATEIEEFAEAVTDALETTDASDELVDDVREKADQLTGKAEELEQTANETQERTDDLEDNQDDHGKRLDALGMGLESVNDDLAALEDDVRDANPGGDGGQSPEDDWTPVERLSVIGEDGLDDHVTASDRRAIEIFEHWADWSTRTPKGNVLKTGRDNLRSLLSTACDERLSWKQTHRACRRLESLSKGRITVFQKDGDWIIQQHDAFASRQAQSASSGDGSPSVSSVGG